LPILSIGLLFVAVIVCCAWDVVRGRSPGEESVLPAVSRAPRRPDWWRRSCPSPDVDDAHAAAPLATSDVAPEDQSSPTPPDLDPKVVRLMEALRAALLRDGFRIVRGGKQE